MKKIINNLEHFIEQHEKEKERKKINCYLVVLLIIYIHIANKKNEKNVYLKNYSYFKLK
jgi:hypothetical protein